jgi:hypothetical protein
MTRAIETFNILMAQLPSTTPVAVMPGERATQAGGAGRAGTAAARRLACVVPVCAALTLRRYLPIGGQT